MRSYKSHAGGQPKAISNVKAVVETVNTLERISNVTDVFGVEPAEAVLFKTDPLTSVLKPDFVKSSWTLLLLYLCIILSGFIVLA